MMKIEVSKARVHVRMHNKTEGSVLQGTVQATCLGIETTLEVESTEPPDRIGKLLRNAEHGCFTMQALLAPVEFRRSTTLNGHPLELPELAIQTAGLLSAAREDSGFALEGPFAPKVASLPQKSQ